MFFENRTYLSTASRPGKLLVRSKSVFIPLFLLTMLCSQFCTEAVAMVISKDTEWHGKRLISETVRVEKGARLSIAPGSRLEFSGAHLEVSGTLLAEGVDFSGANWPGLILQRSSAATRISNSRISGAQTGLLINGGEPQLTSVTLENNQIGIELKQQSRAVVRDCTFSDNRKVGLFVKEGSTAVITGNRFTGNGRFGAYIYRAQPEEFRANSFIGNEVGLMIAYQGSEPTITANLFRANRIGLHVDRSANPRLLGNRVLANEVGIKLQRRADPLIEGNLLQNNETALLISYSSYPQVSGNDFLDNRLALQLEHQSTSWEQANGAASRAQERSAAGAFAGKKQAPLDSGERLKKLDGTIEARNNWWGETARQQIAAAGDAGNLPFIQDGLDQPFFHDGGKDYPLDRVRFYPAAQQPQFREGL